MDENFEDYDGDEEKERQESGYVQTTGIIRESSSGSMLTIDREPT
jgi:hypothetical protein